MKLTVGPLAPAVYWRRRVVVLGGALLAVIVLAYSCSGSGGSPRTSVARTTSTGPTPQVSAEPTTNALLTPTIGGPPPTDAATTTPGSTTAATTTALPAATGPCADAEMALTPVPDTTTAHPHQPVKITFKIKNVSNHACTRDVGADPQELYIQQGTTKVWSSDACDPAHGADVRTFDPGVEATFAVVWDGRTTNGGCTNRPWASAGSYQIVGRLASKFSDPVTLTVTA